MKKHFMAMLLCLSFMLSLPATAFAAASSPAVNLANGVVLSDTVVGIENTGENLVGLFNWLHYGSWNSGNAYKVQWRCNTKWVTATRF